MADLLYPSVSAEKNTLMFPSSATTCRASPSIAHINQNQIHLRETNRKETKEEEEEEEEEAEDGQKKLRCLKWWIIAQSSSAPCTFDCCACCSKLSANLSTLLRRIRFRIKKLTKFRKPQTSFHYDSLSYAMNFDDGSYFHSNVFSPRIPSYSPSTTSIFSSSSHDTNIPSNANVISLSKPAHLCHSSSLASVTPSLCR